MPNPTKFTPIDRPLPKQIRYTTRGFVFRDFTLIERFKLLMGYRVLVEIHFASEHNPGTSQPMTKFHLTAQRTQATAMLELRDAVTAEQRAKGIKPNTLPEGGSL